MSNIPLPAMTLDGTGAPLVIDPKEIDRFFIPLASYLIERLDGGPRCLVGIGGPPACGKSAFAQLLAAVVNALHWQAHPGAAEFAIHVGLDGWHFPNTYLDTHSILRGGENIPLRKVKGSPPSFNTPALRDFLLSVQNGQNPAYPLYSRVLHDPQPGGHILASHRLIMVEGNYLLLDMPPWTGLRKLFDLTIFLTAPREILLDSLSARHLRGGKNPDDVRAHMAFSDAPNLDLVLAKSLPGDVLIRKLDSRRISEIVYP